MITKETLFATRRDATPAQKMDLRLDVEVPAGTQLLKCHKMDDRWLITVNLDGKKMQLVTYRDPNHRGQDRPEVCATHAGQAQEGARWFA